MNTEMPNTIFDMIQELYNTKRELENARNEILDLKRDIREYRNLVEELMFQETQRQKKVTDKPIFIDLVDPTFVL